MAEWSIVPAWKAGVGVTPPKVQILLSPPLSGIIILWQLRGSDDLHEK